MAQRFSRRLLSRDAHYKDAICPVVAPLFLARNEEAQEASDAGRPAHPSPDDRTLVPMRVHGGAATAALRGQHVRSRQLRVSEASAGRASKESPNERRRVWADQTPQPLPARIQNHIDPPDLQQSLGILRRQSSILEAAFVCQLRGILSSEPGYAQFG
jgi:hypothetical protein